MKHTLSPLVVLTLLCTGSLGAGDTLAYRPTDQMIERETAVVQEDLPRYPAYKDTQQDDETVLHPELKGIILVSRPDQMVKGKNLDNFTGFEAIGLVIPGGTEKLAAELAPYYNHIALTKGSLREIKGVISDYFSSYHYPLLVIEVPEQDITAGVLQLVVVQGRLGQISVEGNEYFSDQRILNYMSLRADEPINENQLLRDVNFINRNPFRRVDVIYAPGEDVGLTDITLMVDDRRPLRIYAGAENTGVPTTKRQRWLSGFNWGNAFGLDHIMAYQFTSAYNSGIFYAHTMQYIAPLPWHHVLNLYGGYARVHADIPEAKNTTGRSYQASGRYTIPLKPTRFLNQEITFGFDWKRTNNTLEFSEEIINVGDNVNISEFVFGYSGSYERRRYRLDFGTDLYWAPGQIMSDQSDENYQTLRPDANNNWVYILGQLAYIQRLPHSFSFSAMFKGQWTYRNLLPTEQFYLGGYDTVRGYDQRQVNTDNGILLSTELRTPAFHVIRNIMSHSKTNDALQFLVFIDYGWGIDHTAIPGIPKAQWLMGAGPGLRYSIDPYLTARLDWGIKLHKEAAYTGGNSEVHFSVIASY